MGNFIVPAYLHERWSTARTDLKAFRRLLTLSDDSWKLAHWRLHFTVLEFDLVCRVGIKIQVIDALLWFQTRGTKKTSFHVNVCVLVLTQIMFGQERRTSEQNEEEKVINRATVDTSFLFLRKVVLLSGQLPE